MCMGDIGSPSRILAAKFGAPFTYATFHHERALAPGQLSYQQMTEIYNYEAINEETEVFGVVADPVSHSHSPLVHNAALQHRGINAVYVPFRVPAEAVSEFVQDDVSRLSIKGLSVTIPHKEAFAQYLTKVDPAVKGIAAVNTVLFKEGQVLGYNTDYKAAMDSLENKLGAIGTKPSPLSGRRVLVLGAGGAARAILYGLERRGARAFIASRTRERSDKLADTFSARAVDWEDRHRVPVDILVNATPVGMHPNVDETPYKKQFIKSSMLVFDTVYNPESTLLIKEARECGCEVITGVEMFIRQAALQFYLFTGQEAPGEHMRQTLRRAIGPVRFLG
jgi:3-dehydroquinate dehydratase/shikimate dehydrogenase